MTRRVAAVAVTLEMSFGEYAAVFIDLNKSN